MTRPVESSGHESNTTGRAASFGLVGSMSTVSFLLDEHGRTHNYRRDVVRSLADRSVIQSMKGACLTQWRTSRPCKERKNRNLNQLGRQPPRGLPYGTISSSSLVHRITIVLVLLLQSASSAEFLHVLHGLVALLGQGENSIFIMIVIIMMQCRIVVYL